MKSGSEQVKDPFAALKAATPKGWTLEMGPCQDEISLLFPVPKPLHMGDDRIAAQTAKFISDNFDTTDGEQMFWLGTEFRQAADENAKSDYWFRVTVGEPVPNNFLPAINEAGRLLTQAWTKST